MLAPTFIDYNTPALPEPCEMLSKQYEKVNIKFHPNPTNDFIKAEFMDSYNFQHAVIMNITGQKVWQGRSGLLKDGIRMGPYPSGIDNVLFDGKFVGRFVKI